MHLKLVTIKKSNFIQKFYIVIRRGEVRCTEAETSVTVTEEEPCGLVIREQ